MYLIFDTETTGLPKNYNAPITDLDNWPRCVQLAWQIHDEKGELVEVKNYIVKPDGYTIPYNSEKIHGISTERALRQGVDLKFVLKEFAQALAKSKFVVGHNIEFDINIMGAEFIRGGVESKLMKLPSIDTKDVSTDYCAIPGGKGGKFKWPKLIELHTKLFNESFNEAHNASADVEATARCFLELVRIGVVGADRLGVGEDVIRVFREFNPSPIQLIGLNIQPYQPDDLEQDDKESVSEPAIEATIEVSSAIKHVEFTHLHCHSQFSVLQATSEINSMIDRVKALGMNALALTDHGNMMAVFHFVKAALGKDIKPILGCEFNVCDDHKDKNKQDNGFQQVLLAKNKAGYHNLAKLSSQAYIDGFYYVPRIDKDLLMQYKEHLIATTGGLWGEVPYLILNVGEDQAENAFLWWKENFGEDFYVELNRHGLEEERIVNETLLRFCQKYNVKYFAANNTYYDNREDAAAHDVLLCVKDAEFVSKPKKYIGKRGREFRYGFPNDEFYIKSADEMKELFADLPEAIITTQEITDKIETYKLAREVLLPAFEIPSEFIDPKDAQDGGKRGENAYLRYLTYEGAKKRYGELSAELRERIDFELSTIQNTGYPGYFLIVQDFTSEARKMGVSVGPGRGSAAGSVVAYCTGITNVDPIKYDLLFERFLNPDRVSLPDIDIDFDDEGRGKVIDWVVQKYGYNQVAQIITYGTMAAKSSIRDTARVLELPLQDADRIAKLVPDTSLEKIFSLEPEKLREKLGAEQFEMAQELRQIAYGGGLEAKTINQAITLEGSVRNTGIHACGVIITPTDIRQHVPVTIAKDADLLVTQFDNSVVESAGMLKMDFLGLKTLTIIKDAIRLIKENHGVEIDPDEISLDDPKTFELYQRGETNGTFQFESPGMQKHLRSLKPDKFGDLIAMNALYRPGPLEYIPNFIARKKGDESIVYDLNGMEEYLGETYGITVYQEQVMLLSQKLAGFSKGDADVLRKAMGKKIFALLDQLKPQFLDGCEERGHDRKTAEKVWKDWEAFAAYAFNKSHSTCYSVVAFHTAYLKANYPAEYMAAVLTNNMSDIKKVTFFMEECRRMGLKVLGPDVNESNFKFAVNKKGEIRFGLGAIKGVGEGAVEAIVEERKKNGMYTSFFNVMKRVDLKTANKRCFENIILGGGMDCFTTIHRAQYFAPNGGDQTLLEAALRFGNAYQSQQDAPPDLFGESNAVEVREPEIPKVEKWSSVQELAREKEVVGIYISGHPLDDYKLEIRSFCNTGIAILNQGLEKINGKMVKIAGIVTEASHRFSKKGNPFGVITLEDYEDAYSFFLFGDDYVKYKDYLVTGWFLFIEGKVVPRRWDEAQMDFKINRIELLSSLKDKMASSISIKITASRVNEEFIRLFSQLVEENPGECKLNLNIYDTLDVNGDVDVRLTSRSKKVKLTNEFIEQIDAIPDLDYKIG